MTTVAQQGPKGSAPSRLQSSADSAASAIAAVARNVLLARQAASLHQLECDLREASNGALTHWYDVDLAKLYSPENVTAPHSRETRAGEMLAILAGFGIFVPLLITWNGVRHASETYSALVAADQLPPGASFFALWMSGFDGRSSSFGQVALWTFLTLVVVAVAYTVARILQVRGDGTALNRETKARAELSEAISLAQRAISEARYGDQSSAYAQVLATAEAARQSSEEARKLLHAVRATADRSQTMFDQHVGLVDAGAKRLEAATAVMSAAVDRMQDALQLLQRESAQRSSDLAAAHDRLSRTLTDFDDAAQRRYEASGQEGAAAMQRLARSLADSQRDLEAALATSAGQNQATVAEASARMAASLGSSVQQLSSQLVQLGKGVEELRDNYMMVAGSGQAQVEALEDVSRDLSRLVNASAAGRRL